MVLVSTCLALGQLHRPICLPNYDDTATLDNGTCDYSCVGCLDPNALNYCADCTIDDPLAFLAQASREFTIFGSFGDGICCFRRRIILVSLDGEVVLSW